MEMIKSNVKSRVKHLGRKNYWVREFLANKNATAKHVDTKNNLADIFTKYVPNTVLERLRAPIMGRENPPRSEGPEEESTTKNGKKKNWKNETVMKSFQEQEKSNRTMIKSAL